MDAGRRRRRRFVQLAGVVIATGSIVGVDAGLGMAAVQTDKYVYVDGDTVTISGDSMSAGESVTVDVSYPDGTLAQEHTVVADDAGGFADSYTIPNPAPAGIYGVQATGQSSGSVFATTFDPACAVGDPTQSKCTPTNLTASNPQPTSIDLSWTDTSTQEDGFYVYRSTTNTAPTVGTTTPAYTTGPHANNLPPTDTFTADGLANCTTYYFWVAAFAVSGPHTNYSNLAGPVSATTLDGSGNSCGVIVNGISSGSLNCHYHIASPANGTNFSGLPYTSGGPVAVNTPTNFLFHCIVTATGTISAVKAQGGFTVSTLKTQPVYNFVSSDCPGYTQSMLPNTTTSKNNNVFWVKMGSLTNTSCNFFYTISGAMWKTATPSTGLTGAWSVAYKDSTNTAQQAYDSNTPLTVTVS